MENSEKNNTHDSDSHRTRLQAHIVVMSFLRLQRVNTIVYLADNPLSTSRWNAIDAGWGW